MTRVDERSHTSELGVVELRRICARAGQICREVLFSDVGIDAFIERVQDGAAQGRLLGVQVKSGTSFVNGELFGFTTDYEHLAYWATCAFPVIGVIHDPATSRTTWIDITAACTQDRFNRDDYRLEVRLSAATALTEETLLGGVMEALERFYAAERHVSVPLAAPNLQPTEGESAYETWFRLIGLLIGPSTRVELAADAAFRLSWYMPTVTDDQRAAVASAIGNLTDFQLLKILRAAQYLFEHEETAAMHVVDLLSYASETFARLERMINNGFVPDELKEVAIQMIEARESNYRGDLRD
jgi:hypothetical protein